MKNSLFYNVSVTALLSLIFCACAPLPETGSSISLDLSAWMNGSARTLLPNPVSAIQSIELSITGPGMTEQRGSYPAGTASIQISVPSGPSRTISLSATLLPGTLSAINKLTAEALTDLEPGPNQVILTTGFETKIIVPDNYNGSIKQFDDLTGANPKTYGGISEPIDIDYDSLGRVYIAGYSNTGDSIYCTPYIDASATPTALTTAAVGGETSRALAIDRENNFLYHITCPNSSGTYLLYKMPLNATNSLTDQLVSLPASVVPASYPAGLAVDGNGFLYMLANDVGGSPCIFKLDPSTVPATVLAARAFSAIPQISTSTFIMAKEDKLYLSSFSGYPAGNAGALLELSGTSLATVRIYSGGIIKPSKFLAIMNKKIYIISETAVPQQPNDQIVCFEDFDDLTFEAYNPGTLNSFFFC